MRIVTDLFSIKRHSHVRMITSIRTLTALDRRVCTFIDITINFKAKSFNADKEILIILKFDYNARIRNENTPNLVNDGCWKWVWCGLMLMVADVCEQTMFLHMHTYGIAMIDLTNENGDKAGARVYTKSHFVHLNGSLCGQSCCYCWWTGELK